MNTNKKIKVVYQQETKRLAMPSDFQSLVDAAAKAFKLDPPKRKFYYLDPEDQDLLTIDCQSDFQELDCDGPLKIIIADNINEAREMTQMFMISDSYSIGSSMMPKNFEKFPEQPLLSSRTHQVDQSTFFDCADLKSGVSRLEQPMTSQRESKKHEIACGSEIEMPRGIETGTDAEVINREDFACNTIVKTNEMAIGTQVMMNNTGSQAVRMMHDVEMETNAVNVNHACSQMELERDEKEISCQILVPEEESPADLVDCFKCLGTQTNKKGMPCRKCNGTGSIASKELAEVSGLIKEQVTSYCQSAFRDMLKSHLKQKREDQNATIHDPYECDGCGAAPITGVRYKCAICHDYDLCEKCEENGIHSEHQFLKIRKPNQAPVNIVCQMKNSQPQSFRETNQKKKEAQIRYSGRFVKESFGDKFVVAPGDSFSKTWVFRNDGKTAWSMNTQFIQTNGDDLGAQVPVALTKSVESETEHTWEVQMKAPEKEGLYTAYFRMQIQGTNIRFGHKVWCNILVTMPGEDEQKTEFDVPVEELGSSQVSISSVRTPRQVYMEHVSSLTDGKLKEALIALFEAGFTEFGYNKTLLEKNDCNVNTVATILIENRLSESMTQEMFK